MERTKPEYPGALALKEDVPTDPQVVELFKILLASNAPVGFGPGSEYPAPSEIAQRFGFKSQLTIAIYPKIGKPWVFGVHQCSYPRVWTQDERKLFKEIGWRITDGLSGLLIYRELQDSEEKYRELFEESLDGIFISSPEGKIIDANKKAIGIFGYDTKDEVLRLNLARDIYANPEDRELVLEKISKKGVREFDVAMKKKNGKKFIAHTSVTTVRDENGTITSYRGIVRDVAESYRTEII
jgi:PAS domain S-box-containing protein